MHAKTLDHIVLEVKDLEASLGFYRDLLGMEPVRLEEFYAHTVPFASVKAGATLIDLFVTDTPRSGLHHFCVEVSDSVKTIVTELKAHDVPYSDLGNRFGAKGQGTSVYVTDPDGYSVEIRTYVDMPSQSS